MAWITAVRTTIACWVLPLLLFGVARMDGQDVLYNFDPITDFSKYKTYKWIEIKGNEGRDPEAGNQIKEAVDAELSKKGLVKRDTDPVDLYVGYQFALTAETRYHTYEDSWEPGADWQDGWAGRRASKTKSPSTKIIYTGQLALDMYETTRKILVWRSVGSKTIDLKASPERRQRNIAKAAVILLKPYPPKRS